MFQISGFESKLKPGAPAPARLTHVEPNSYFNVDNYRPKNEKNSYVRWTAANDSEFNLIARNFIRYLVSSSEVLTQICRETDKLWKGGSFEHKIP